MSEIQKALKLSPDCFTPLARTPWAGTRIHQLYKSSVKPSAAALAIGESWEVSCDPDFPSQVVELGISLLALVQAEPQKMLSPRYVQRQGANCEILIKLLNAASPLSVQVHPQDDDPRLSPQECGKPESWLILDVEPGAGLYLGFSKPLASAHLRQLLVSDEDLRPYLYFVPVQAGDYFEIQPGVPHAIGPGITLLEPQRVLLGKSGKTYRFWDWGRRYDKQGALDMHGGQPRALHIDEGLRLIDSERQVGSDFVASLRRQPEVFALQEFGVIRCYPANASYQVLSLQLTAGASLDWTVDDGFATLVSLKGAFSWESAAGNKVYFSSGEPGFLPYAAFPMRLRAESDCELALVVPSGVDLRWTQQKTG